MSKKDHDDVLQDYLDGRLGDGDRAEFEKRLANEPELAKRVAESRAIGRVLRGAPAEVPPGFYARARERFEKAHAPRRVWHRVMSWEAAGLATAGLLLAAVLLPDLWLREQRDLAIPLEKARPAAVPEKETSGKADVALEEEASVLQEPADAFAPVPQEVESRFEDAAPETSAMLDEAAPPDDRAAVGGRVEADRDDVAGEGQLQMNRELERAEAKVDSEAESDARLSKARGFADAEMRKQPSARPSGSISVGQTMLEPGSLAVIEDTNSWNALPDDIRRGLSRPDFSEVRIALIGPRARPFDCAAIIVREEVDRVVIEVWPGDEARPDKTCAVSLPTGPLPVVIEDRLEDDR